MVKAVRLDKVDCAAERNTRTCREPRDEETNTAMAAE